MHSERVGGREQRARGQGFGARERRANKVSERGSDARVRRGGEREAYGQARERRMDKDSEPGNGARERLRGQGVTYGA